MSRSSLYAVVGVLAVAVIALAAYLIYEQSQKPHLDISIDKGGIQVQGHG